MRVGVNAQGTLCTPAPSTASMRYARLVKMTTSMAWPDSFERTLIGSPAIACPSGCAPGWRDGWQHTRYWLQVTGQQYTPLSAQYGLAVLAPGAATAFDDLGIQRWVRRYLHHQPPYPYCFVAQISRLTLGRGLMMYFPL